MDRAATASLDSSLHACSVSSILHLKRGKVATQASRCLGGQPVPSHCIPVAGSGKTELPSQQSPSTCALSRRMLAICVHDQANFGSATVSLALWHILLALEGCEVQRCRLCRWKACVGILMLIYHAWDGGLQSFYLNTSCPAYCSLTAVERTWRPFM